ncbi:MAG: hypothetical protein ACI9UD_001967 [Glaciecola sp.]|jgi:hypothetical protein
MFETQMQWVIGIVAIPVELSARTGGSQLINIIPIVGWIVTIVFFV